MVDRGRIQVSAAEAAYPVNARLSFARLVSMAGILYGFISVVIIGFVVKGEWDEQQTKLRAQIC